MGDIHGGYKALLQCLELSGFRHDCDRLIQLGDICDGYPEVYECVEELLKVKNLVAIKGNHDAWLLEYINTGFHPYFWNYGGKGTLESYIRHSKIKRTFFASRSGFKTSLSPEDIPEDHVRLFQRQAPYFLDDKHRFFVHAGFNRLLSMHLQKEEDFYWNRTLWSDAMLCLSVSTNEGLDQFYNGTAFKEVFIGHTPTTTWDTEEPMKALNIINLDTGAGHGGKLTIMDVDTKEFWQSDSLGILYGETITR